MKKLLFLLLPLACVLAGCKYDDTSVWDELNAQKAKIAALEGTVSNMNSNISSLQSLITAIQDKVTINGVSKTEDGYLIAFSDGNTARINNGVNGTDGKDGVDGEDGVTPQIGAKADTDGKYYWTVNGEWLLDAAGEKVHTSDTPKVKIEDDQWMVSYDGGSNWVKVEGQGASASCVFESVVTDADNAKFTLSDGTVITVPLTSAANKLQLVFDESVFASMRNGELLSTSYKIVATEGAKCEIETFESDGWTVTIRPVDETTGRISIQAPEKVSQTKVLFLLTDDAGGSFIKIINIGVNDTPKPAVKTEYTVDYLGGEFIIPLTSSTATIGDNGESWMKLVSVGDQVVLNISSNDGSYDWRTARVTLEDGTVITITQTTEDALVLSKEVINIDGRRQMVAFVVNANMTVTASVTEGSDWLSVTPSSRGLASKIFTFSAKRNTSGAERTGKVEFSGKDLSKTCTIIQAIYEGSSALDVTEASAAEDGEAVELGESIIVAGTTDGYVVSDGDSYLFVKDADNAPSWAGDSVSFDAVATEFNGLPALGSVQSYTTVKEKNQVTVSATDITSKLSSFTSEIPAAVKVKGDFVVNSSGDYSLIVKGSTKTVVIYKPASYLGITEQLNGYNITLTGIYYGESDGAVYIIATRFDNNGLSIQEGDQVSVSQFIALANTSLTLKVGPALVVASSAKGFLMEQDGARIYVYGGQAKVGDNVTVSGKYSTYNDVAQLSNPSVTVNTSGNAVTYPQATDITSSFASYTSTTRDFVTYTGTLEINDKGFYNIAVNGSTSVTGSILQPSEDISSLNGKEVTVKGYYLYHASKGKYLYVIATSINGIALVGPEVQQGGEQSEGNEPTIELDGKAYKEKGKINGSSDTETVYKLGTSSAQGSLIITLPAGTKKISFYAVSWNSKPASIALLDGTTQLFTCSPATNTGASSNSPYTLTLTNSDYYSYTFDSALSSSKTVILTTTSGNKRVLFYKIQVE